MSAETAPAIEPHDAGPPPADGMRRFVHVLVNTALANLTTSYLWFALTFWIYLETRSVLATGIVGGSYMLLLAVCSIPFGTLVDRQRKHRVMIVSSTVTTVAFALAAGLFALRPESDFAELGGPWFWAFTAIILLGSVVEMLRNIALSTTVTLLVPVERHANANGLVGTVQGIAFIVTSVFSGLSVGFLGMGGTLAVALGLTALTFIHLLCIRIPERQPEHENGRPPAVDLRGSVRAIRAVPGLIALILFTTLNNLIGGVYMALMDPYGLELFSVQMWGVVFGVASTGFIIGGIAISTWGLGKNPIRTMLLVCVAMGLLGSLFTIRDAWWLYAAGIWAYMALIPAVEASEQTVIQKVVPFRRQGRVFGFAQAFESAAAPITAFLIAPLAEFWIIPYLDTPEGAAQWGPLLGDGRARGIALVFFFSGLVLVALALLAFTTKSYRLLSAGYRDAVGETPEEAQGAGAEAAGETEAAAEAGQGGEAAQGSEAEAGPAQGAAPEPARGDGAGSV